jgi:mRNA-degrading endonuclease toxin of MazEF toxin-antitoxin module
LLKIVCKRRGRVRTMPSTAPYKRGQVIVVNVPFSNHTGIKPRPALVISTDAFHRDLPDLVVCPISSSPAIIETQDQGTVRFRSGGLLGFGIRAREAF